MTTTTIYVAPRKLGPTATTEDAHKVAEFLRCLGWVIIESEGKNTYAHEEDRENFSLDWDSLCGDGDWVSLPPTPAAPVLYAAEAERIQQVLTAPDGLLPIHQTPGGAEIDRGLIRHGLLREEDGYVRLTDFAMRFASEEGSILEFHPPTWEEWCRSDLYGGTGPSKLLAKKMSQAVRQSGGIRGVGVANYTIR